MSGSLLRECPTRLLPAGGILDDVRCSVLVERNHAVLLIHRTHDRLDDWVLPGGTPREGERHHPGLIAACWT
jgi:8-oxo-dGTP pyrophosphatase MutT (NUDIX family)